MVWSARLKQFPLTVAELVAFAALAVVAIVSLSSGSTATALGAVLALAATAFAVGGARGHARQAAARADEAVAREREARLLTEAATSLLSSADPQKPAIGPGLERALAEAGGRLELCHAPAPKAGELALPLRLQGGIGWLYIKRDGPWQRADAERVLSALAELIALAQERTRVADSAAEAETARHVDVARTAIMHAISHDLRGPLTAIATASGALGEPDLSPEAHAELTGVVTTETRRLARMVDDLLDLSRIEAGAVNPEPEWCDLSETIARAATRVRAQRGDFPITVDIAPDLPRVRADAAQLERVFTNLIDNAAKFSPAGKPVEVRGICANGRVTIRVVDHGRGIPAAQQSQIFKPFVRGRDAEPGSGLGLAICRGFVEANGGRIALQSRGRDGSAFAVSFPNVAQPEPSGSGASRDVAAR